jgi:hypothetical protein
VTLRLVELDRQPERILSRLADLDTRVERCKRPLSHPRSGPEKPLSTAVVFRGDVSDVRAGGKDSEFAAVLAKPMCPNVPDISGSRTARVGVPAHWLAKERTCKDLA